MFHPYKKNQKNKQACGAEDLYQIVEELVSMPSAERKAMFAARRAKMLSDKIDCAKFLTYFIDNYPQSVDETRYADAEFWLKFK